MKASHRGSEGGVHPITHASLGRRIANWIYNRLASYMTGKQIDDLMSGFRAARSRHFSRFLYLLPNGFSYPATSTMAFILSGLPVAYVPIRARQPSGKSPTRLALDGMRFFMIILDIGTLYSPMRLFLPVGAAPARVHPPSLARRANKYVSNHPV